MQRALEVAARADSARAWHPAPARHCVSNCVHEHGCTCSGTLIARYQKRLSGPLLDRIDIHVEVPRVPFQKLSDDRRGERSAAIRARVEAARARQTARFAGTKLTCNADMGPTQIKEFCTMNA